MDTVKKSRNPTVVLTANGGSAHSRGGTGVRLWLESVLKRATTRGNACCPVAGQALRRPRILPWVGQRSKATIDQRREELSARQTTSYLMSFQGYPPILKGVRPQQRSHRILQIQYWSAVTDQTQETAGRNHPKPKTEIKRETTIFRTIRCQIFLIGWRSSKKIWWRNCLHTHRVLRKQTWHFLYKWQQNHGSTAFKLIFRKTEIAT